VSAGTVRIERQRGSAVAHAHPLATRRGAELLAQLLAAGQVWDPLTARQKRVLSEAYSTALAAALAAGGDDGTEVPLPRLVGRVAASTVASLERRGLVADGALTELAVEVVRLAEPLDRHKAAIKARKAAGA
jgi:hypothetical protein